MTMQVFLNRLLRACKRTRLHLCCGDERVKVIRFFATNMYSKGGRMSTNRKNWVKMCASTAKKIYGKIVMVGVE
jgi:hypothetical protein